MNDALICLQPFSRVRHSGHLAQEHWLGIVPLSDPATIHAGSRDARHLTARLRLHRYGPWILYEA